MRHRSVALGLLALAGAGCNNDYPIAPTRCDDYCRATQRADCDDDWPDQCVTQCEVFRSPTRYPSCADRFEALLGCYDHLNDSDFLCRYDLSEPLPGLCESEERDLNFCTSPVFYRCLELCETRGERCPTIEPNGCVRDCAGDPSRCEAERVRYLDCELSDEMACLLPSPMCLELAVELTECLSR